MRYKSDCEQFYGRVLDVSGVVSSVNGNCKLKTEELWKKLYPEEPYDLDLDKVVSEKISDLEKCTKYDLVSAVKRQSPFYYQVTFWTTCCCCCCYIIMITVMIMFSDLVGVVLCDRFRGHM